MPSPRDRAVPARPRVGRRFVLKLSAALVALASILIVAAVWSLGESAQQNRRSQVGDQIAVGLSSALGVIERRLSDLDADADRFVRNPPVQQALARGDAALLERLASGQRGIAVYLDGRRLGRESPKPRLRRELVLRREGHPVARVVASAPVDQTLYAAVVAGTRLAQGHRLLVVVRGRVLLGGERGARVRAVGEDTAIGGTAFVTRATAVPGTSLTLLAAAPVAAVEGGVKDFQLRLLLAAFGSLALLVLLAAVFGGPIMRALGDLTRVTRAAELDALTGVANRGSFDARLAAETRRALDLGTALSLILLDVDRFKAINDTHGHQVGDEVLRRLGALLQDRLRDTDFGARYGGEEFAILLPGTDSEGALILAERLRTALSELRVETAAGELTPTASFGVASYPEQDASELVAAADAALYEAKRTGRNRSVAAVSTPA